MKRHKFTFSIEYYKPSGKFYVREQFDWECPVCEPQTGPRPIPYMHAVQEHIRGLRDNGGRGVALPGLSGNWPDGLIRIDCEDGFPVLILPSNVWAHST